MMHDHLNKVVDGGMEVVVISPFNPDMKSLVIKEESVKGYWKWVNGEISHIQDALPELSADEREFLINGIPVGEFDIMFPPEEDE